VASVTKGKHRSIYIHKAPGSLLPLEHPLIDRRKHFKISVVRVVVMKPQLLLACIPGVLAAAVPSLRMLICFTGLHLLMLLWNLDNRVATDMKGTRPVDC
jgi:hypothetical protein